MKLQFSIHYNTAWGQRLHVAIDYMGENVRTRHHLLPMNTEDGEVWTLETSVMESRQKPVTSIRYVYQVMDGEGRLLRKEWDKVPRLYAFDSTRDYYFPDQWRDTPLLAHLYTEAFTVTTNKARHSQVKVDRMPLFRRTIIFRVSAPQIKYGESLGICGSHPAMGSWSPSRFLRMNPIGDGDWMLSVNIEGMPLPLEYKYVVVDDKTNHLVAWEDGDNRSTRDAEMHDGQVLVLYGGTLRISEAMWRAAGVALPLFSLKTENSFGVGDFGDLQQLVDWAVAAGLKIIQLLPVADTTSMHSWSDSHPYNVVSGFALHPHYVNLDQLGTLDDERMVAYNRQRRELNALDHSDYMAVDRVKMAYVDDVFAIKGKETLMSEDYQQFVNDNEEWLAPYCAFCILRDLHHTARFADWGDMAVYDETKVRKFLEEHAEERDKIAYLQYHLHRQLKKASDYAHLHGVAIMGDLPIGIYRDSVETWRHPEFFEMNAQVGTPPDQQSYLGQNWGFPPYCWVDEEGRTDIENVHGIFEWLRARLNHEEQFFDAIRIDHAVGYFRIWEIPANAVLANMGHFSPALPLSEEEITRYGLVFRRELHTRPFINDRILDFIFGIHAEYVKEHFLIKQSYGLYALKEEYDSQVKVRDYFGGLSDENSIWIRDGLYRIIANVLFLEDRRQPGMYHPRFMVYNEPVYDILSAEDKDAFMRLYNNYYYERHNAFWKDDANRKIGAMLQDSRMLVVAEDLGMLPSCVGQVLDNQRILSLEIQSMPKQTGLEFSHLEANPYRSLCTISTHDMAPLRLWWEENIGRTQRYYATVMQQQGRAPKQLPPHLAEMIVARQMYSPSMLCILSIQDWLAMDQDFRCRNAADERINSPYDEYNQWKYRMYPSIEQLKDARRLNAKIKTMVAHSKR